mmetsp:Transcript_32292/g.91560  ORF Transcript_32292/g.91560 Transcript_32292/m.91560 type:complete len:340 (-) Transcript_32292:2262-3281(-)
MAKLVMHGLHDELPVLANPGTPELLALHLALVLLGGPYLNTVDPKLLLYIGQAHIVADLHEGGQRTGDLVAGLHRAGDHSALLAVVEPLAGELYIRKHLSVHVGQLQCLVGACPGCLVMPPLLAAAGFTLGLLVGNPLVEFLEPGERIVGGSRRSGPGGLTLGGAVALAGCTLGCQLGGGVRVQRPEDILKGKGAVVQVSKVTLCDDRPGVGCSKHLHQNLVGVLRQHKGLAGELCLVQHARQVAGADGGVRVLAAHRGQAITHHLCPHKVLVRLPVVPQMVRRRPYDTVEQRDVGVVLGELAHLLLHRHVHLHGSFVFAVALQHPSDGHRKVQLCLRR